MKQGKLFSVNCTGVVKWKPSKPLITPSIIFSPFIAPATEGHYWVYLDCHYFRHSLNKGWSIDQPRALSRCAEPFHTSLKLRLKPNFQTTPEFSLTRLPPNKRMQIYTPNVRTMSNSSPTTATRENCKWLIFVIFCLLRPWRPRSDCRCMQVCLGPWLHYSRCWHRLVMVSSDAH